MTETTLSRCPIAHAPADAPPVPAHVPPERVLDTRFAQGQIAYDLPDPYLPADVMRDPDVPRILYYPWPTSGRQHGAWTVSHYDDIRRVYEDNDTFSTEGAAQFQALAGETFPSIPLGIDPPDHGRYRRFLNPWFTPVAMNDMEPKIRAIVSEMIDAVVKDGEVDIAYDFGRIYPVRVFLNLMGFPFSMFDQFLEWEYAILHNPDIGAKAEAVKGILAYLRGFIAEKQANPDETLGSYIANGSMDGQPLTPDETIGMTWFLWLGGLDTVASTISQMFPPHGARHRASGAHPCQSGDHQQRGRGVPAGPAAGQQRAADQEGFHLARRRPQGRRLDRLHQQFGQFRRKSVRLPARFRPRAQEQPPFHADRRSAYLPRRASGAARAARAAE